MHGMFGNMTGKHCKGRHGTLVSRSWTVSPTWSMQLNSEWSISLLGTRDIDAGINRNLLYNTVEWSPFTKTKHSEATRLLNAQFLLQVVVRIEPRHGIFLE